MCASYQDVTVVTDESALYFFSVLYSRTQLFDNETGMSCHSTVLTVTTESQLSGAFQQSIFFSKPKPHDQDSLHKLLCTHPAAREAPSRAYLVLQLRECHQRGATCQQARCSEHIILASGNEASFTGPPGFPEGNEESTGAALGTGAANDTVMLLVKERPGET